MIELLKTPTWLKGRTDMPDDERLEPPPIATMPEPSLAPDDNDEKTILGKAALIYENLKTEINRLKIELTETTLRLESEKRKTGALEADLAEAHNNLQTLEPQLQQYTKTFQDIRQRLDQHGITPPEKNGRRNGNGNKKK